MHKNITADYTRFHIPAQCTPLRGLNSETPALIIKPHVRKNNNNLKNKIKSRCEVMGKTMPPTVQLFKPTYTTDQNSLREIRKLKLKIVKKKKM